MACNPKEPEPSPELEISDEDVYEAMRAIPGFLDITPGDWRDLYRVAYRRALERIRRTVKAADIMTRDVAMVRAETPIQDVAELMAQRRVSGVPVVDQEGKAIGIISETDFLSRMGAGPGQTFMGVVAECLTGKGCLAAPIRPQRARDIMASPPVTVTEDADAGAIAAIMTEKGVNRVPVVDPVGRTVGVVTRGDLVRAHLAGGGKGE
jgi:CBS-domain-containing membrane protein